MSTETTPIANSNALQHLQVFIMPHPCPWAVAAWMKCYITLVLWLIMVETWHLPNQQPTFFNSFVYSEYPILYSTPSHQRPRKCQNMQVANNHHTVPEPLQTPATACCLEWMKTTPMPPLLQDFNEKHWKCHQYCQNVLQCFLAMSAMIGLNYVSNFDDTHSKGVPCC